VIATIATIDSNGQLGARELVNVAAVSVRLPVIAASFIDIMSQLPSTAP